MKNAIKNTFYYIGGLKLVQWLARPWRGRCIILCYHRVLPNKEVYSDQNPNAGLSISETRFEDHMAYLSKYHNVVSMDELVDHLNSNSKEFVVAVTFDDGYNDNLLYALPILERYNIPATIYITTRFLEKDAQIWWYELWDKIKSVKAINYKDREFNFFNSKIKHKIQVQAFKYIHSNFMTLNNSSIEQQLVALNSNKTQYLSQVLSVKDVLKLSKKKNILIGNHAHNHDNLKYLSADIIEKEITKAELTFDKYRINYSKHLALPYGGKGQIPQLNNSFYRDLGYKSVVTTMNGTINNNGNYQLPRINVGGHIDKRRFKCLLSGYIQMTKMENY